MNPLTADQLDRLQAALSARATEKSRTFWQKYLKGNALFRGVPMALVRKVIHAWWSNEALHDRPPKAQKQVALRLFEEPYTEDKLAGVLALSEILLTHLSKHDLPDFARLFEQGHIADWNLCDWFCVKVLGNMLKHTPEPTLLAKGISTWRTASPLWQRRASCVAFVHHAKHGERVVPGLPNLLLTNCDALVRDPQRFVQTGAGWVLRELSLHDRALVIQFAQDHLSLLSREGIRYIVEKMPTDEKKRLLALHKQARS